MSSFTIDLWPADHHAEWDAHIARSVNGTLFHRLGFLAYHGDRFVGEARHLAIRKGGALWGQLSIALRRADGRTSALSPYGGSYGGIVVQRPPTYRDCAAATEALLDWFNREQVSSARLTFPPACCAASSLDTLHFALLERGFKLANRDISSVFLFNDGGAVDDAVSQRARRMGRRAAQHGLRIVEPAPIDAFWPVLEQTFVKHGSAPTHSHAELAWLLTELPHCIYLTVAEAGGEPVAGIAHFVHNARVIGSFYLCQTRAGDECQALTGLVLECLRRRSTEGYGFYDFGTSSVNMRARANIFEFKENFTRTGYFRDTYEWSA